MNTLDYLFNANLYLLLFFGCYWLLRRNTFFGLNRCYLLLSLVASLLLPLLDVSGWWPANAATPTGTITLPAFVIGRNTTPESNFLTGGQWFWLAYGLGVALILARLALNLRAVFRVIGRGRMSRQAGYTLVVLPDDASSSFSFGRYLVLNHTDAQTKPDALLFHEQAHIRQGHTADVLLVEVVRAAFWFNPILWLYKRALQEVHEFLADRAALHQMAQETPTPDYARQLVAYALNVPSATLTTSFSTVSTLKQRIVMLQKPPSQRRALLGYALVLPLAGLLTLCTQPDRNVSEGERPAVISQPARQAGVEGEIFTVAEHQPEFPGGVGALGTYLSKNRRYPAAAQKANVQGNVFVSFIVTKNGDLADVKIVKGIGFGTDEEAIRVMQAMPRWKPATQSGQPVNIRYYLPIKFRLM